MNQTRAEIMDFVCSKLEVTDDASVERCNKFIAFRYKTLWNLHLWRKSLTITTQTVLAGTELVELDEEIAIPVAVRWDSQNIGPINLENVFQLDPTIFDRTGTPVAFAVLDNTEEGLAVIQLLEKPTEEKELFVLGKKVFVPLVEDEDRPRLDGMDNALIAFVEGDMLERKRQYEKAREKFKEARGHLQIMLDLEAKQGAHVARVVPEVEAGYEREDFGQ